MTIQSLISELNAAKTAAEEAETALAAANAAREAGAAEAIAKEGAARAAALRAGQSWELVHAADLASAEAADRIADLDAACAAAWRVVRAARDRRNLAQRNHDDAMAVR